MATIALRKWIYAMQPKGTWYKRRQLLNYIMLAAFFAGPFIHINGHPLILIDIIRGKFILFGSLYVAQDFIFLGIGMLLTMVLIIVVTLRYGRVFCGWACPQTVFLEMVFRKVEYWIEGPAHIQKKNSGLPMTANRAFRRTLKHLVFVLISLIVAHTVAAYLIGIHGIVNEMYASTGFHWGWISFVFGFAGIFYAVFASVREIVCTVICPYGRLQGVLTDADSLSVAYEYNRGEPRSRKRKEPNLGDCIDCNMCVNVCPTGIDIRNGIQMECVQCTACIDACDAMMENVGKPKGLIGFYTATQLQNKKEKTNRYRNNIYTAAFFVILGIFAFMFFNRKMFDSTIIKVPGLTYQIQDGIVSNLFSIKVINKSLDTKPFAISVAYPGAEIEYVGNTLDSLRSGVTEKQTFFIRIPKAELSGRRNKLKIDIWSGDALVDTRSVVFLGQY